MKQTDNERILKNASDPAELDGMLEQLAEDVPPMPADFREKWMKAVREEARKTEPAAEEKTSGKRGATVIRWTRILSVAAAFVFLIGGTLLYRSGKNSTVSARRNPEVRMDEIPEETAYTAGADFLDGEETAGASANAFSMKAAGAVYEEKDAGEVDGAVPFMAMDEAMEVMEVMEEAEEETADSAIAAETAEPAPEAAEEPAEQIPVSEQIGAFFADMGAFLLAALPYLLGAAALAAALVIIRRTKGGKR